MTDTKTARKVLFVTSNRIGDCVISSGVIREIARQVPGARITVACGRPPAPFFRSAPDVERVIILDKKKLAALSAEQLDKALAFATRAAAITCSRPGADPPWARELA